MMASSAVVKGGSPAGTAYFGLEEAELEVRGGDDMVEVIGEELFCAWIGSGDRDDPVVLRLCSGASGHVVHLGGWIRVLLKLNPKACVIWGLILYRSGGLE
jgi:hypothetical protein